MKTGGFAGFPGWAAGRLAALAPQPLRLLLETDGVQALQKQVSRLRQRGIPS